MARSVNGTSDRIIGTAGANYPTTGSSSMVAYVKLTTNGLVIGQFPPGPAGANTGWSMYLNGNATNKFSFLKHSAVTVASTMTMSTGVPYILGIRHITVTSCTFYRLNLNTGLFETELVANTNAITSAATPRVMIGTSNTMTGAGNDSAGTIAEVMVWNKDIGDNLMTAIVKGGLTNARLVERGTPGLVLDAPLYGFSPEPDLSSQAQNLTLTGTTIANHSPTGRYAPRPSYQGSEIGISGSLTLQYEIVSDRNRYVSPELFSQETKSKIVLNLL